MSFVVLGKTVMNSTAKIIFGSFLAISISLMFLVFSMQKSAQLTLDMRNVQQSVKEKDRQIAVISNELESAKAITQTVQTQNKIILEIKSHLQVSEQEKQVYIQQLDDSKAELKNQVDIAEKRLAEFEMLQKQQEKHQQLLAKGESKVASADEQKVELVAALQAARNEIEILKQTLVQFTDTLEQKDRVIEMSKEILYNSAKDIALLRDEDTSKQLNLNLVLDELTLYKSTKDIALLQTEEMGDQLNLNLLLDELASKMEIIEELTIKLEEANNR